MAQWRPARTHDEERVRFSRTLFLCFIIAACALVAFDRPENRAEPLSQMRAAFNDLTAPVLQLASVPIRRAANVGPWWRRQFELAEENAALREEIAELRAWERLAVGLRDQIELYEEALNLQAPPARQRITTFAVAERGGPFVRSQLIGIGRDLGVRSGHPVLNVYGLVGRTVDVGRRSSRVLMLTDLNSRVAVMADRSNARAMLVGDNSDFPRLDYLGREPDLRVGDRIITSGDDNVMPRGMPVGEAVRDRDGRWRVRLYTDAAPIDLVWVYPFEPVRPPEPEPEPAPEDPLLAEEGAADGEAVALNDGAAGAAGETAADAGEGG